MVRDSSVGKDGLAAAISLAAVKNGEFTRNPRRSNSLQQTLLQRRHWFHLMAIHEQVQSAPPTPARPSRHSKMETNLHMAVDEQDRCTSPFPYRKRRPSGSDDFESGAESDMEVEPLVIVLSSSGIVSKKRRCELNGQALRGDVVAH